MPSSPAGVVPVTGTGTVLTGPGVYKGLSIKSTTAGTLRVFDNTAASGPLLAIFELAAGAVANESLEAGVNFTKGLHVAGPGVLEGSVRI
jgi:hypothetical protein